ncbi:hypothetical protein [Chloracidobacterium thermophilum]|uniref:hypothetical protein n=1 Tax=Chloracidobacterium thermophilum TaxID=458033 RepID=UPI0007387FF2|nr:hypothetical protein [Chloracidobacterium thermophilum]
MARIVPDPNLTETKLPDATPGLVSRYALDDEQALLAKVRYNRLIDMPVNRRYVGKPGFE